MLKGGTKLLARLPACPASAAQVLLFKARLREFLQVLFGRIEEPVSLVGSLEPGYLAHGLIFIQSDGLDGPLLPLLDARCRRSAVQDVIAPLEIRFV